MTNLSNQLLLLEEKVKRNKEGKWLNKYRCHCGKEFLTLNKSIASGNTRSCGCFRKSGKPALKHGLRHHPLYLIWKNIKNRCLNKNHPRYKDYGGRGVSICDEWRTDFVSFYTWALANGWEQRLEIDKDMKGNGLLYGPETCTIVTPKENSNYTRKSRFISYNGKTMTLNQWVEYLNITRSALRFRLKKGWDIERALTTPVKENKRKKKNIS